MADDDQEDAPGNNDRPDDDYEDLLCHETLDEEEEEEEDIPRNNDDYGDLLCHETLEDTPVNNDDDYEDLLCHETLEDTPGRPYDEEEAPDPLINEIASLARTRNTCACCNPIRQGEYVRSMLQRETALEFGRSMVDQYLVDPTRPEAISWILKARGTFGFQFQTAYMSVTCFDRFLSKRTTTIPDEDNPWLNLRTITMGCVSLTVKMEEGTSRKLRDYRWEGYQIDPEDIKKVEFEIFFQLDWNSYSVSPFAFLPYFIANLFENPPPDAILLTIYGFIFSLMREVNLMAHRPSAIAAAAAIIASDQSLSRRAVESRMNPIVCPDFPDIEHVFRYYELMRRLGTEDLRQANGENTPQVSPNAVTPANTPDDSSRTSSATSRRRLDFGSPDQPKEKFVNGKGNKKQ